MAIFASNFSSNSLSGTATVVLGNVTINLTPLPFTLEGDKSFVIKLKKGSAQGTVIATSPPITIKDRTTVVNLSANTSTVGEGNLVAFSLVTTNVVNGATVYYSVLPVTANVTAGDFESNTGSVVITNNSAGFALKAAADVSLSDETGETFQVQLRAVSNTGVIAYTTSNIAILDTYKTYNILGITSSNTSPIIEDTNVIYTFTATNVPNGIVFYYNTTGNVNSFTSNTGSFVMNGTSNAFVISEPLVLYNTSSTFNVEVRTDSSVGNVVATSNGMVVLDIGLVPNTYQSLTVTGSNVNQGGNVVFTLSTNGIKANSLLYYTTVGNVITTDFISGNTGSFRTTNNSTTITLTSNVNVPQGETRNFQLQIRPDGLVGAVALTSSEFFIKNPPPPPGQTEYTLPGTYSWIAPESITSVSVVAIGGGGGGGGYPSGVPRAPAGSAGGLGWKNNIPVVAGNPYTVVVGAGGPKSPGSPGSAGGDGGTSYFIGTPTVSGGGGIGARNAPNLGPWPSVGGGYTGDGGGAGGNGGNFGYNSGGGGAGGYSGTGGSGGTNPHIYPAPANESQAGSGGGGGGGGGGGDAGGGGGGVGIYGEGPSGASVAGVYSSPNKGLGGYGGSGGGDGIRVIPVTSPAANGGTFGGGGAGSLYGGAGGGAGGAVRIIWGLGRAYPNTNTANV